MKKILPITILLILALGLQAAAAGPFKYKSRSQFDNIFDEVARNFGAVESAYYTYTLEFEKPPGSIQEMIDTGHLNIIWANPYTGNPVQQTDSRNPGDISWEILPEDETFVRTSAFYVDFKDPKIVHWMTKTIMQYTHEEMHNWVFDDELPREEIQVRIYCIQFEDALESFEMRFGRLPESFEELAKGDINVAYINPITGEAVKSTGELSPGDFWYQRLDDDRYAIVGWGYKEPIYFMSNDRSYEEFEWEGDSGE